MKKLYFARHGQSVLNVSNRFAGHTDTPLTPEGQAQAKLAGQEAKNLNIDTIVASPLSRAHDTAKIIASEIGHDHAKIMLSPLLMERYYGSGENEPYSTEENHLEENHVDFETEADLNNRVTDIMKWLQAIDAENILVVSHGGIGRRLRSHLKPDHDLFERIPNAHIVRWL